MKSHYLVVCLGPHEANIEEQESKSILGLQLRSVQGIYCWQPVIDIWSVPGSGLCVATRPRGSEALKGAKDSLLTYWYLAKVDINQIHSTGSEQTPRPPG